MILYIWINKYKNIEKTGFNLSSKYNFTFKESIEKTISNGIEGELLLELVNSIELYPKNITDFKVIVGENGSGKSSLLELIINNLINQNTRGFDGFLVTDEFIFYRDNSKILYKSNEILKLSLINNYDILNFKIPAYKNKIDTGLKRLVEAQLKNKSIIYYNPIINIDKVRDNEGVSCSTDNWEIGYEFLDISTENKIVSDYNNSRTSENQYRLSGDSELLAFKIYETKRSLEFLFEEKFKSLMLFDNKIEKIYFSINSFYDKYWKSIDDYFKTDNQLQGNIQRVLTFIDDKKTSSKLGFSDLESNLYKQFTYGVLKYEFEYRQNFGNREDSNALIETLRDFQESTKLKRTPKTVLDSFLSVTKFNKGSKINIKLFDSIIKFIINNPKINIHYEYGFEVNLRDVELIKELFRLIYTNDDFINKEKYHIFNFFLIEFLGLSNGEKSFLSLFARLFELSKYKQLQKRDILLMLDEPEVGMHPQWQTEFVSRLLKFLPELFAENKVQILLTTHSPILLSDFPSNHVLYLKKDDQSGKCIVDEEQNFNSTFAANIHALYSNAFFLREKGAAMGSFAKNIIIEIVNKIKNGKQGDYKEIKNKINIIGEPLIKDRLNEMLKIYFPEEDINIENIDLSIELLEKALFRAKELKAISNETSK
jgi:predicted ATPase